MSVSQRVTPALPLGTLDPRAKPTSGINLRLNRYQLELLRQLAAADERSLQQTIKRLLIPAAERAAQHLVTTSPGGWR